LLLFRIAPLLIYSVYRLYHISISSTSFVSSPFLDAFSFPLVSSQSPRSRNQHQREWRPPQVQRTSRSSKANPQLEIIRLQRKGASWSVLLTLPCPTPMTLLPAYLQLHIDHDECFRDVYRNLPHPPPIRLPRWPRHPIRRHPHRSSLLLETARRHPVPTHQDEE
jgi:hypothetical protein